jgi:hypothetical protein
VSPGFRILEHVQEHRRADAVDANAVQERVGIGALALEDLVKRRDRLGRCSYSARESPTKAARQTMDPRRCMVAPFSILPTVSSGHGGGRTPPYSALTGSPMEYIVVAAIDGLRPRGEGWD